MQLSEILETRNLHPLFQPILDIRSGELVGYEGLIRGPANSPFHAPLALFSAVKPHGLSLELEMLCRKIILEKFAALGLPGKVFLNVSPEALAQPNFKIGETLKFIAETGITPERVIIELTENQPIYDFDDMRAALLHYRRMGFSIAMDDLGAGFSSLRLWSELRPDYVKIDMHFIQGVNTDPLKLQFLKSIQSIAESSNTLVIAEGIETPEELMAIRDIGIAFGQGYFIARPAQNPPLAPPAEVGKIISRAEIFMHSGSFAAAGREVTAEALMTWIEPVGPDTENEEVFARFNDAPELHSLPVVKNGVPVGLINRYSFIDCFAQPYRRELLGKKPCNQTMQPQPLIVDRGLSIQELSDFLVESENRHFTDGFIVTDGGRYAGLATAKSLLREITRMQIEAARYANPLTMLPGNVPVNEQIERLLRSRLRFVICYCDLDNFKPFNDIHGYRKGDEMIQLTARTLKQACYPALDFVGHIGGDDFILLMQSSDWSQRCEQALQSFSNASLMLFGHNQRHLGGYESEDRQGRLMFHPFPTLSIGAVQILPGDFSSHHEVSAAAAEAKKMAKRSTGNSLFVEKRSNRPPVPAARTA